MCVVEVFCDNDASAYGRKPRWAYERMLAAVKSASIDAIVTWHDDHLHRPPKDLARAAGGDHQPSDPEVVLAAQRILFVRAPEGEPWGADLQRAGRFPAWKLRR